MVCIPQTDQAQLNVSCIFLQMQNVFCILPHCFFQHVPKGRQCEQFSLEACTSSLGTYFWCISFPSKGGSVEVGAVGYSCSCSWRCQSLVQHVHSPDHPQTLCQLVVWPAGKPKPWMSTVTDCISVPTLVQWCCSIHHEPGKMSGICLSWTSLRYP